MKTRIIGAVLAVVLALVGAVVLTGWVNSAESRAMAGAQLERAYVVNRTIPENTPGEKVQQYLTVKNLPEVALVPGRVKNLDQLRGLLTTTAIQPGEQLLTARFVDPKKQAAVSAATLPADKQALTIALPIEQAVGGTLKAGDTVGVVVASDDEANKVHLATQKLHNVQVLSVESGTALSSNGSAKAPAQNATAVEAQMVTLAVDTDAATQVVWGQKFGTIWLTLEQKTTSRGSNRTVDGGNCTGGRCMPLHNGKATNDAGK